MNTNARVILPVLLLTFVSAAAFCLALPRWAQAETPDHEIPIPVKGHQFTVVLSNGDRLAGVSVTDVVLIHKEPWWRVTYPVGSSHSTVTLTINPRQIQMLADLP